MDLRGDQKGKYREELVSLSGGDRVTIDEIIFTSHENPFGISHYDRNKKVTDFVGRKQEIFEYKEYIREVANRGSSIAVRLEGPAGVGKTTLFNYIKEYIENERTDTEGRVEFLDETIDVLSSYFQVPGKLGSFRDIWSPFLEGLMGEIEAETSYDITFPEYVCYKLIYRMFELDRRQVGDLIWGNKQPPKELKYIGFLDIVDEIYNNASEYVEKFRVYFNKNKRNLRRNLKTTVNGLNYEITRRDTDSLLSLFYSLDEDRPYTSNIIQGLSTAFSSDDTIINYFNLLTRWYTCATGKQLLVMIGIDEVAKYDEESQLSEFEYFRKLGNLLVRLRDSLNNVIFTFISTTGDWMNFDEKLEKQTDLQNQFSAILKTIQLKQLEVHETIQVFSNRMARFWDNFEINRPVKNPDYPFSKDLFEYVYRFNSRDLRRSIITLDKAWKSIRFHREIPYVDNMFRAMAYIRELEQAPLNGMNIKKFEWKIVTSEFEKSHYNANNTVRSSAYELALENLFKTLQQKTYSQITKVRNNQTIKTEGGNRRPDIYVEIAGNLGTEYMRRIEFQVKAYKSGLITQNKIKSSVDLFNEGYTDYLYFILIGNGFDSVAQYQIHNLQEEYPNRIITPELRPPQIQMLKFLVQYNEIFGWTMGEHIDIDLPIAENAFSLLFGQSSEEFFSLIKNLPMRKVIKIFEEKDGDLNDYFTKTEPTPSEITRSEAPAPPETSPPDEISNNSEGIGDVDSVNGQSGWLSEYKYLVPYKYESCGLATYLSSRETGRNMGKFTIPTVLKNVIKLNSMYSESLFKDSVKVMENSGLLIKVKSSYQLTEKGWEWYNLVKSADYQPL